MFIEANLATTGTDVAVVRIRHLTGTIDDAAHNTNFQTYQMTGGSLDLGYGLLQVVERTTTARAGDILCLGELNAGSLKDAIGKVVKSLRVLKALMVLKYEVCCFSVDEQGTHSH